jgi:hypothetical protein
VAYRSELNQGGDKMRKTMYVLLAMALLTIGSAFAATSGTHETNVTITSGDLYIVSVTPPTTPNPTEYTTTATTTYFVAGSDNGWEILTGATCEYTRSGETTRVTSGCTGSNISATDVNYTCPVTMQYYDGPGTWDVNCTIGDGSSTVENTTETFTYGSLTAMQLNYTTVLFGSLTPGTQSESSGAKTVVNTGNNAFTNNCQITAQDLYGVTNASITIAGSAFRGHISTGDYAGATSLASTIPTAIPGSTIAKGAVPTGTRDLYYYILAPIVQAQAYTTVGHTAWTVTGNA